MGVVMATIMMTAMYVTYSVVNNSYSQVTDRAKISRAGRDMVGMMMKDRRAFDQNEQTRSEAVRLIKISAMLHEEGSFNKPALELSVFSASLIFLLSFTTYLQLLREETREQLMIMRLD